MKYLSAEWDMVDAHLATKEKYVLPIRGEGFCFLQSVLAALQVDHGKKISLTTATHTVMNHLLDQANNYEAFFDRDTDLVEEAFKFFSTRHYDVAFVDLLVPMVAEAFVVNFKIYQQDNQRLQRMFVSGGEGATGLICLKFSRDPQHPLANHYEAVVKEPAVLPPSNEDIAVSFDEWHAVYAYRVSKMKDPPSRQEDNVRQSEVKHQQLQRHRGKMTRM